MTHREKAEALFKEGYNCSQAVFGAFAGELGVDEKTALMLAAGLGGGVGRLREVCGAVTGMALAISARRGYYEPTDTAAKGNLYAEIQQAAEQFRARNGAIVCKELLGEGKSTPVPSPRNAEYFHKRPCVEMVGSAAEILEKMWNAE